MGHRFVDPIHGVSKTREFSSRPLSHQKDRRAVAPTIWAPSSGSPAGATPPRASRRTCTGCTSSMGLLPDNCTRPAPLISSKCRSSLRLRVLAGQATYCDFASKVSLFLPRPGLAAEAVDREGFYLKKTEPLGEDLSNTYWTCSVL